MFISVTASSCTSWLQIFGWLVVVVACTFGTRFLSELTLSHHLVWCSLGGHPCKLWRVFSHYATLIGIIFSFHRIAFLCPLSHPLDQHSLGNEEAPPWTPCVGTYAQGLPSNSLLALRLWQDRRYGIRQRYFHLALVDLVHLDDVP